MECKKINSRAISHSIRLLLVLLSTNTYVWLSKKLITLIIFPHCSLLLGERWLPLVTHVTSAYDLTQFNSTHKVKLIKHIFKVSPKVQLFEVLRNQGVIMWCITWLLPFTQSISPLINLVMLLVLGWLFYHSKNSKPNRLASLFGRKIKDFYLIFELFILPVQYPELVLAIAFVKTFPLLIKMSSLALF